MRIEETKKIRRTLGLTQVEFAKELGVSRQSVAYWETNRSTPSPAAIKKLIAFCKLNDITIER